MAQFAFNNSAAVTGISPFYANYGKHPSIEKEPMGVKPIAEKAQVSVQRLKELQSMLKEDLEFISQRTAKHANRKRSEGPDLRKGGMVYLLRKNIKTKRPSDKLDHTKLGPFKIKDKLGPVTFRLNLPEGMRIHPVFHVLLLEPAPDNARLGPIQIDEETQTPLYEVDEIIGHKEVQDGHHYLIHWQGYQHSEDTWEPEEHLTPKLVQEYRQNLEETPPSRARPKRTPHPTRQPRRAWRNGYPPARPTM